MTNEQIKRTNKAVGETIALLAKAASYSPEFRDMPYIDSLNAHLSKLRESLK